MSNLSTLDGIIEESRKFSTALQIEALIRIAYSNGRISAFDDVVGTNNPSNP